MHTNISVEKTVKFQQHMTYFIGTPNYPVVHAPYVDLVSPPGILPYLKAVKMKNHYILSPFFLDAPEEKLEASAKQEWTIIKPALPSGDKQQRISAIHRPLADIVQKTLLQGKRPVSISGDCCSAIAVLAGLRRAGLSPTILWFDAHGDFNTRETSPSGFLGGMPLAMIVGRGDQTMPDAVGLTPYSEIKIILTDARDLDTAERDLLKNSSIVHISDVSLLQDQPFAGNPLYIHFDTDIINPDEAPAMNYPASGGPSVSGLEAVFRHLARTCDIRAVSMSAWSPGLDTTKQTEKACMKLLKTLVGN